MSRRRTNIAAGVVIVGIAAGGALAASAQEDRHEGDVAAAPSAEDLTAAQLEAIEAVRSDAPIPVQDVSGDVRGYVRDSALTARDERVTEQMVQGFRERHGSVDEEYDELYEALRILDPVPVVDDTGATVGYWTHNFKELSELEALTPDARATVDRLLLDQAGE